MPHHPPPPPTSPQKKKKKKGHNVALLALQRTLGSESDGIRQNSKGVQVCGVQVCSSLFTEFNQKWA